jgi:hypothetical protein
MQMSTLPEMFRIALSPFQPRSLGLHSVVGDLAPHGFLPHQLCLLGTPTVLAPLATSLDPASAVYPELRHLLGNLETLAVPYAKVPIVASAGPITDVLLKHKSWLSAPAASPLKRHLESGDVALAINALDHDQFVTATRLLLSRGSGNVLTEVFNWPTVPLTGQPASGKP